MLASMCPADPREAVLELGCDHLSYGEYEIGPGPGGTAWAISVGADRDSPSLAAKGDPAAPNEDGLAIVAAGGLLWAAVADGHHGIEASHDLLRRLVAEPRLPRDRASFESFLVALSRAESGPWAASNTSLVMVAFDPGRGHGFGLSFGDSTCAQLGPAGHRRHGVPSLETFVSLARPARLAPERASLFELALEPGELLLLHSDGLDECHYGRPATSVRPELIEAVARETDWQPRACVGALMELALQGVDGHPGGQDNIAIVGLAAGAR